MDKLYEDYEGEQLMMEWLNTGERDINPFYGIKDPKVIEKVQQEVDELE